MDLLRVEFGKWPVIGKSPVDTGFALNISTNSSSDGGASFYSMYRRTKIINVLFNSNLFQSEANIVAAH